MVDLKAFQRMMEQADAATPAMKKLAGAMRQVQYQTGVMLRPLARLHYSAGDHHIDRVCKEILAGKPGRPAHIRLDAAVGLAEVLDQ
jgi:hypothetical protein